MEMRIFQPPESAPASPSICASSKAEAVQHFARARFELVAAAVLILLLDVAEALEHLLGVVARRIAHGVLELDQLVMQVAEASAAGDRFVEDGAAADLVDLLAEVADRDLLRHGDRAVVRRLFADDHAEQRRLAGAIRPDQTGLLAGVELERGVDEEDLLSVLLADVGKRDHARAWNSCACNASRGAASQKDEG